jgi:glycosyltransferase involved in cell wall biosynthesis
VPSRDALGAAAIAYEADDPEALAGVLGDLLARPEKLELMRAAAKRRRRDLYDESRAWGAQLLDLISEVAGGARSPRSRERAVARAI